MKAFDYHKQSHTYIILLAARLQLYTILHDIEHIQHFRNEYIRSFGCTQSTATKLRRKKTSESEDDDDDKTKRSVLWTSTNSESSDSVIPA